MFLGNNYLKSSPNSKSKVSFEILKTCRFKNWPYLLNLVKIWGSYCQKTKKRNSENHPLILKIDWFTLSLLNLYFSAWHELNKRSLWSIFKSVTVTETSSKLFIIRHKKVGVRGRIREAIKIEWGQDSQDHMSLKTLKNLLFKEKIHLVNTWSTDWPESNLNWHTFLTKTDLTGHTN